MSNLLSREYEVSFSHIDNRGVARPSFLFDVMQDAATVHAELLQVSRDALRVIWMLSRIRVTLRRPLLPYERIRCETWCPGIRGASWYRSFAFFAEDREIGTAQSMWVTLDPVTRRILRPTSFSAAERWMHGDGQPPAPLGKLCCENTRLHHVHTVRYGDLDINNHVNNVKVVDLIADALDLQKQPGYVSDLQVNYTAETHFGQQLSLQCGTVNSMRFVRGEVDGAPHFEAAATFSPLPTTGGNP